MVFLRRILAVVLAFSLLIAPAYAAAGHHAGHGTQPKAGVSGEKPNCHGVYDGRAGMGEMPSMDSPKQIPANNSTKQKRCCQDCSFPVDCSCLFDCCQMAAKLADPAALPRAGLPSIVISEPRALVSRRPPPQGDPPRI